MNSSQYPIGPFERPDTITAAHVSTWIGEIGALPDHIEGACAGLSESALDTPSREGGWTPRQVVHRVAESHMNSYIRFKLALTEDRPQIRPYFEDRWAALPDTIGAPISLALPLIRALHLKWVYLLQRLGPMELARTYLHPDDGQYYRLDHALGIYAWHGRHHVAHITTLRERMGWTKGGDLASRASDFA